MSIDLIDITFYVCLIDLINQSPPVDIKDQVVEN